MWRIAIFFILLAAGTPAIANNSTKIDEAVAAAKLRCKTAKHAPYAVRELQKVKGQYLQGRTSFPLLYELAKCAQVANDPNSGMPAINSAVRLAKGAMDRAADNGRTEKDRKRRREFNKAYGLWRDRLAKAKEVQEEFYFRFGLVTFKGTGGLCGTLESKTGIIRIEKKQVMAKAKQVITRCSKRLPHTLALPHAQWVFKPKAVGGAVTEFVMTKEEPDVTVDVEGGTFVASPASSTGIRMPSKTVWVLLGTSVAAGVTGLIFNSRANQAADDAAPLSPDSKKYEDLEADNARDKLVAQIGYGIAGAALIGAAIVHFAEGPPSTKGSVSVGLTDQQTPVVGWGGTF